MPKLNKKGRKRNSKMFSLELGIFLALLLVIAGTFLVLHESSSITAAAITTLPTEEIALIESINASLEQTTEMSNETSTITEIIRKESSSIGIQGISIQNAPTITIILNTTNLATNDTNTNLTAYNTTQTNGNSLKVIYNWLRNNTPIAMVNMPFEGINGSAGSNTWDYSEYENNGSVVGATWNSSGGYDGKGAYMFDGVNDVININDTSILRSTCIGGCTLAAWIKLGGVSDANRDIIARWNNLGAANYHFEFSVDTPANRNRLTFTIHHGEASGTPQCSAVSPVDAILNDTWMHVVARYNLTHTALFTNGTQIAKTGCGFANVSVDTWLNSNESITIGAGRAQQLSQKFNGTIDEVMIFNRSLSAEQIFALWQNQTNVIVAQETQLGENWTVQATPNNGTGDGVMVISGNVTILDKTVPTVNITFPANGSNFSAITTLFNATISDSESSISAVIFIFNNGTNSFNLTASNSSGTWNVTINTSTLAEGLQGVAVSANDSYNNINYTQFINFTIDRSAPSVSTNDPSNSEVLSGTAQTFNGVFTDTYTSVQSVNFQFSNGSGIAFNRTGTDAGFGNIWQITGGLNTRSMMESQVHTVTYFANDSVGNLNNSFTITVTVDNTPPYVNITNPSNGSNFSSVTYNFNATIRNVSTQAAGFLGESQLDAVIFQFSNFTGNDFNRTPTNVSGTWNTALDLSTLIEGSSVMTVFANDTENNLNSTQTITFTVDRTSPNVTINSLNANNLFNGSNFSVRSGNVTFNVSAFDTITQINKLFFWLDNGTGNDINITGVNNSGQWTVNYNVSTLAEGRQGVRIIANDTVNNVNNSAVINFTVDKTAPSVNITSPVDSATLSGTQTFNVIITDNLLGISTVLFQFTNSSNPFNRTASNSSGTWNVSVNTASIGEGILTVTVFANDTVGNLNSTQILSLTVDNIAETVVGGGGGGGSGGSISGPSKPTAGYVCGNGILENGEHCDSGEGCNLNCKCAEEYKSVKEVNCEKLPYCGDGIVNTFAEQCDAADTNGQSCSLIGYTDGKLLCTPHCIFDVSNCLSQEEVLNGVAKEPAIGKGKVKEVLKAVQNFALETAKELTEKQIVKKFTGLINEIVGKISRSIGEYTIYWSLSAILIVIVILGLYVRDLPVPEFMWKMKPTPQVKIEQSPQSSITIPSSETDIHLRSWGKKNYLDLQQELKRVDALIKETPMPEQKNKALKLTSLKNGPMLIQQKQIIQAQEKTQNLTNKIQQLSPEEIEQWVIHMFAFGTSNNKITTILKNATLLDDSEIKTVLVKARTSELLEKKYAIGQKTMTELKNFIRTEKKKGTAIEQIIADLAQEGWDEKVMRLYVTAYYR